MKTLEDFKGTKYDFYVMNNGVLLILEDGANKDYAMHFDEVEAKEEDLANFKLFANSYNLLRKSYKALEELKTYKTSLLNSYGFS